MPPRIDLSRRNQVKADPYASRTHRRIDLILVVLTIIILFVLLRSSAHAATFTWTGDASANQLWSNANNWGGIAPTSATTTDLVFQGTTNTGTSGSPLTNDFATPFTLNSITFNASTSSFFLGGNQLDFNGSNPTNTNSIIQNSSSAESIANPILLDKKTDLTDTGPGTGIVTLSGNITQANNSGSNVGSLTKTGTSTYVLSGNNTYSGGTTVSAGTLLVSNTAGSGTGSGAVTVNGSGTTLGGTGTISGTVTLGATTPGAILNPGPKGTNGTSGSVGTLTTGALTLTGANTVHIDAFGTSATQWDKLISTGAISLGTTSALDVTIASGLTFTAGSTYVLLNGTSLTGTFSGIANNQTVSFHSYLFTAQYTSTGFDLVAVPEPGTWCAAALAFGVVLLSQKRRLSHLLIRA